MTVSHAFLLIEGVLPMPVSVCGASPAKKYMHTMLVTAYEGTSRPGVACYRCLAYLRRGPWRRCPPRVWDRTHCKRGHEFTPENTYMYGTGRHCRVCTRLTAAARKTGDRRI